MTPRHLYWSPPARIIVPSRDARGIAPPHTHKGRGSHGALKGVLLRPSHAHGRRSSQQAQAPHQEGGDRPDRLREQVRCHQDAPGRAGQPQLPAPQLCPRRRGRGARAGRQAVHHGLQHALRGRTQERARPPRLRLRQWLQPVPDRLPHDHRRRPQGPRRGRGARGGRRVREERQDRPRAHGRGHRHQPHALQGPRAGGLRRHHEEPRHGRRLARRQDGAALRRQAECHRRGLHRLPPVLQDLRARRLLV